MKKRMFSIFMSICMVFCLIPLVQISASAASAACILDINMFHEALRSSGEALTKLEVTIHEPIPDEVFAGPFNLNESGSVVGYVVEEDYQQVFRIAPERVGDEIYLPENSSDLLSIRRLHAVFREVDLRGLNTSHVRDMGYMFFGFHCIESINLSGWDTSNVTNMDSMFNWCDGLETLNIESFNTARVINMAGMFYGCRNLRMLDLRHFTTSSVENMRYIFGDCNNLQHLNLDSFDVHGVTDMEGAFYGCNHLETLSIPLWNLERVENTSNMFNFGRNGVHIHCTDNMWEEYCLDPEVNGGFVPVHQL